MPKAILVAGLLYGDESKGATVEKFCNHYPVGLVVRYNGGAQAAHNVVLSDGSSHTFQQFGSGTFQYVPTYLSEFHRVDLLELVKEAQELQDKGIPHPLAMMKISRDALVVTPMHYKGDDDWRDQHGITTCGMGVGEAAWYANQFPDQALYIRDFSSPHVVVQKLRTMIIHYETFHIDPMQLFQIMNTTLNRCAVWNSSTWNGMKRLYEAIVFEGAQGVQLDYVRGTIPYVTSTDTTFNNALYLLGDYPGTVEKWGCMRCYATRHGAGPLPNEAPIIGETHPELHNTNNKFQGRWRTAILDYDVLRDSIDTVGGLDYLAVSHLDRASSPEAILQRIERELHIPIGMTGYGPKASDREILV